MAATVGVVRGFLAASPGAIEPVSQLASRSGGCDARCESRSPPSTRGRPSGDVAGRRRRISARRCGGSRRSGRAARQCQDRSPAASMRSSPARSPRRMIRRRPWRITWPGRVIRAKRSALRRFAAQAGPSTRRFIAAVRLWASTMIAHHAALAPNRPDGKQPPARSCFITACTSSLLPQRARYHQIPWDSMPTGYFNFFVRDLGARAPQPCITDYFNSHPNPRISTASAFFTGNHRERRAQAMTELDRMTRARCCPAGLSRPRHRRAGPSLSGGGEQAIIAERDDRREVALVLVVGAIVARERVGDRINDHREDASGPRRHVRR